MSGIISTITIPLRAEQWQIDLLNKRFETCRIVYNTMLNERLKALNKMKESEEYLKCMEVIRRTFEEKDAKKRKQMKSAPEYKKAVENRKQIMINYGFSDFSFRSICCIHAKYFKDVLPTNVVIRTIGIPMWAAFQRMLYGDGKSVHFKKAGSLNSIATNGISGIRIIDDEDHTTRKMERGKNYYCIYTSKKSKDIKMPLIIDSKDKYLLEMMNKEFRVVRVIRKRVNGKDRFVLQLTLLSAPVIKYNSEGKEVHPIGQKKLGIYIDTVSMTITDGENTEVISLRFRDEREEDIGELSRYMDRSKRISNAENFNEDGTVKKGLYQNGRKIPLTWNYSHGYRKAKDQLANIRRIQSEQRRIHANIIANSILEKGCDIHINDYSFREAAHRKKFKDGEELTKSDSFKSTKKGGKKVMENAPAMVMNLLDSKLKARGYNGIKKYKISVDNKMEDYKAFYAKELFDK